MEFSVFESGSKYIWYNGKMSQWGEAATSILAHGLHYASSAFEGIRFYNGKPFKLIAHIKRLFKSAAILQIEIPYTLEDIENATHQTIIKNNLADTSGYIRPIIWLGAETAMISGKGCATNIAIAAWQLFEHQMKEKAKTGLHLMTADWIRPNANMWPVNAKISATYAILTMVKKEAHNKGYDDALMLDSNNNITECTTSNFFLIKNNVLYTPAVTCFLNGITRQTIIDIALSNNIKVKEITIPLESLKEYEAAFITGTACEVVPIASINVINNMTLEYDNNHQLIQFIVKEYQNLTANSNGDK